MCTTVLHHLQPACLLISFQFYAQEQPNLDKIYNVHRLLYLLAKEDAAYKADFEKSQTQTQDQDVFNDPDFVADLDQANFLEVSNSVNIKRVIMLPIPPSPTIHFQVSRLLRGKAKSTQQPVPPSPASLKVVQRITEMKSRLHDSNCEIAHNLTPVQSERKTKRKKRRCNCLNSVDIHTRLEEVMGAWNAVLLSGNKHTSSDCFQKTNYVESRVPNHQLYFPSGKKVEH